MRQKLGVENFESKILSDFKLNKAGLRIAYRIAYSAWLLNGWVDGWMGGLKLNYNGGPFSKMVGFLKIKFLVTYIY